MAAMVKRTRNRAGELGVGNLRCEKRDVFRDGFDAAPGSPSLDIRPRPEDCLRWAAETDLSLNGDIFRGSRRGGDG